MLLPTDEDVPVSFLALSWDCFVGILFHGDRLVGLVDSMSDYWS